MEFDFNFIAAFHFFAGALVLNAERRNQVFFSLALGHRRQ